MLGLESSASTKTSGLISWRSFALWVLSSFAEIKRGWLRSLPKTARLVSSKFTGTMRVLVQRFLAAGLLMQSPGQATCLTPKLCRVGLRRAQRPLLPTRTPDAASVLRARSVPDRAVFRRGIPLLVRTNQKQSHD